MTALAAISLPDPNETWANDMGRAVGHFVTNFQSRDAAFPREVSNNLPGNLSNQNRSAYPASHVTAPSLPNKYGANTMDRASPRVARKPANGREEVRTGLHLALTRNIPTYRIPAKEVADLADTSEGTVRSLRQANIPEAMVTLVMLGRAFPEFRSEVARLMGLERDLDPDFQRSLAELMRRAL